MTVLWIAQLGTPDIKIHFSICAFPIQIGYHFLHSQRLNLAQIGKLHFQEMDVNRFRCRIFFCGAGKRGGNMPTVLNAANEVAVAAFLNEKISFLAD